jgi:[protein-PII] uridylyltransferase
VAELVDALVSGISGAIHGGSSPFSGTNKGLFMHIDLQTRFNRMLSKGRMVSGKTLALQFTYIVDGVVFELYQSLQKRLPIKDNLCIIAVGGYGRLEICPNSDIDILYLYKDLSDPLLAEVISTINNYLYDSGKQVGHSCRNIEEVKQYLDTMESFYSILDARFLTGSESLFHEFSQQILHNLPQELHQKYKQQKIEHLTNLLSQDTPFLVSEPNIKTAPFALRDMQTIYWLEKLDSLLPATESRKTFQRFTRGELSEFEKAYDFFLKLRIALHTVEECKQDRLDLRVQPQIADYLQMSIGVDQVQSIEKLMNVVYSHFKHSYFFIAAYLNYLTLGSNTIIGGSAIEGLNIQKIDTYLYPAKLDNFFTYPETLNKDIMTIFSVCQKNNLEPSPILINELRFVSNFLEDDFKNSKVALKIFLELLKTSNRIGKILTVMHHCNILGKLIPEFGACKYFALFSYHHEYPVDEHTLFILRELDKLVAGTFDDLQIQKEFDLCKNIHVLILAILIHDAGKVKEFDHCKYGAELANSVGERMGLGDSEIELFHFLVEYHIEMSELSTKRDISDPELIRYFANIVRTEERLRLLYILTIIDTKSVGPNILTNWKKEILNSLFKNTLEYISNTENSIRASIQENNMNALKNYLVEKERIPEKFMEGIMNFTRTIIPETYISYNSPIRILQQYVNYTKYLQNPIDIPIVEFEKRPAYISILIYSREYKYLSSDITGTLSYLGLNVAGMRTFRCANAFAINQIQVTDKYGGGDIPQEILEKFQSLISKVCKGELQVENLLSSPLYYQDFPDIPSGMVEEMVAFNNDLLDMYTILEVRLPDELGLLYRIIKQILSFNVHLDFVRIATSADYAHDSFYLRAEDNGKITDQNMMDAIVQKIRQCSRKTSMQKEIVF